MSHSLKVSLWVVAIVVAVSLGVFAKYRSFETSVMIPYGKPAKFTVKPGMNITKLADAFQCAGLLKDKPLFIWTAKLHGFTGHLKEGEYLFPAGSSPQQVLQQIVDGNVVVHRLTIIEGWTFSEMMQAIEDDPYLVHTLKDDSPKGVMSLLGHPGEFPEGRFFPDTYFFPAGTTDVDFLQRSYKTMQMHLKKQWENRAPDLPYKSPYQALIIASMVEKETARSDERPLIAEVINQRLAKGMRLQIDPTVIYGLGKKYTGVITKKDLETVTPYNTYRKSGLPPTPICLPSLASIHAVMHPVLGTYVYYVATGYGGHFFSSNYQDHLHAIKKFLHRAPKPPKDESKKRASTKASESKSSDDKSAKDKSATKKTVSEDSKATTKASESKSLDDKSAKDKSADKKSASEDSKASKEEEPKTEKSTKSKTEASKSEPKTKKQTTKPKASASNEPIKQVTIQVTKAVTVTKTAGKTQHAA